MIEQKVPLVCYKAGSDEIVGVNMNFIMSKEDHFMDKFAITVSLLIYNTYTLSFILSKK